MLRTGSDLHTLKLKEQSKAGINSFGIIRSIQYYSFLDGEGADAVSGFRRLVRLRGGRSRSSPRGAQHKAAKGVHSSRVNAAKQKSGSGPKAKYETDSSDGSGQEITEEFSDDGDEEEDEEEEEEEEEEEAHSGAGISVDSDGNPVEVDSDGEPVRRREKSRQSKVKGGRRPCFATVLIYPFTAHL